ncbi:hypothetical protein L596_004031 [Steinernema carpocapsae]|uniref:Uncharacterized protein n=1 Tax=Steinernema carpocapsae TaxID=34508 RepID=A0A4U8UW30_STECR|nr:hypothetical protein L596_004031 [Steinernema carpocapsae]
MRSHISKQTQTKNKYLRRHNRKSFLMLPLLGLVFNETLRLSLTFGIRRLVKHLRQKNVKRSRKKQQFCGLAFKFSRAR